MPIESCINLIEQALNNMTDNYFRLTTTYEPTGIVRERVFCYELYHQIRLRQPNNHNLSLNGEIDKRGHVDFDIEDRKNPDFVFHIPGEHHGNTLICEVKGILDRSRGIVKDFETISLFISKYGYLAGVFVLYNHSLEELRDYIIEKKNDIENYLNGNGEQVHIIVKVNSQSNIERTNLGAILGGRQ